MISCGLNLIVHGVDLGNIARIYGITAEFAISGEETIFGGECLGEDVKIPNLAVMGKTEIDGVEHGLNRARLESAGNQGAEIPTPIPDQHDMLCARKKLGDFIFDGFGSDVMAGIENNQILQAADNAPIAVDVDLALVASVKPAVLEDASGFLGPIPITGENIRAAHDDLFVVGCLEFDAGYGGADVPRFDRQARIIERANPRCFGESVSLQHGNTEHEEELLRLRSKRSGTADEGAEMGAKASSDLPEYEVSPESEPHAIKSAAAAHMLAMPAITGFRE